MAFHEIAGDPAEPLSARAIFVSCVESGADSVLIEAGALPPEFFDLSTGVAGDLVQQLTNYGIRLAAIVPDPTTHSRSFQEFAGEANRGRGVGFFPDRDTAVRWLNAGSFGAA